MAVPNIKVSVDADPANLKRGLADASQSIKDFASKGELTVKNLGDVLDKTFEDATSGIAEKFGTMSGLVKQALQQMIVPSTLLQTAIATIGPLAIAAFQQTETKISEAKEELQEFERVLALVKDGFPALAAELEKIGQASQNVIRTQMVGSLSDLSEKLSTMAGQLVEILGRTDVQIDELTGSLQQTSGALVLANKEFTPFVAIIQRFADEVKSGATPNVEEFRNAIADMAKTAEDAGNEGIQALARQLLNLTANVNQVYAAMQRAKQATETLGAATREEMERTKRYQTAIAELDKASIPVLTERQKLDKLHSDALAAAVTDEERRTAQLAHQAALRKLMAEEAAKAKPARAGRAEPEYETEEEENRRLRERLERRLQTVAEFGMKEEEQLRARYERMRAIVDQASQLDMESTSLTNEQKIANAQRYHQIMEDLEAKHQKALEVLRMTSINAGLSQYANMFGSLAQLARAGGDKFFNMAKAFGIAEALINTYVGVTKAYAQGGFLGLAMGAAVLAKGLAAVATIAATRPGGGARPAVGGGGGGGGGVPAGGGGGGNGNGGMGNAVYINLQGQSFGRDQVRALLEQIANYQRDGGQVVLAP